MFKNKIINIINCKILKFTKSSLKILIALTLIKISWIQNSQAQERYSQEKNPFYLQPALTLEYNMPSISGSGDNKKFNNKDHIIKQLYNFENIAVGAHVRFHDNLGINANWVQSTLDSPTLQHIGVLSKDAIYKIDHYNFSFLTFVPIIKEFFDVFAEAGVADIRSTLTYQTSTENFTKKNTHETRFFYGLGLQIAINDVSTIRFSLQRYTGSVGLINSNYTTARLGFVRYF